jgi:zinc transport system ATP-binding protein
MWKASGVHKGIVPHRCGQCCTQIERISVTISRRPIIEDISLHLHCGELTTVVGPNGAGKSTLLKALLGEVAHTGTIRFHSVFGPDREDPPIVGYVPQSLEFDRFSPFSVSDLFAASLSRFPVAMGSRSSTRIAAMEALKSVDARELIDRRLGKLSGGELQRVLLALSLTPMPNILLLDEPVSGIDLPGRELFYRTVSELRHKFDLAILMVSHDLAGIMSVSDRIVFLNRRIISVGTPAEVLANREFRHAFGLDLEDPK